MDVEETVWAVVKSCLDEAEDAPDTDYKQGFGDALSWVLGYLEDNFEIEEAAN